MKIYLVCKCMWRSAFGVRVAQIGSRRRMRLRSPWNSDRDRQILGSLLAASLIVGPTGARCKHEQPPGQINSPDRLDRPDALIQLVVRAASLACFVWIGPGRAQAKIRSSRANYELQEEPTNSAPVTFVDCWLGGLAAARWRPVRPMSRPVAQQAHAGARLATFGALGRASLAREWPPDGSSGPPSGRCAATCGRAAARASERLSG